MKTGVQAQVKAPSQPAFAPVQAGLLQRKCACGGSAGLSGQCDQCQTKKLLGLQTKLAVSEPGDIYEQEADRIAVQVLAMPIPLDASGAPPRIQRFAGQLVGQAEAAPASVGQALASPGRPHNDRIQAPQKMNPEHANAEKSAAQARTPSRPASYQRPRGLSMFGGASRADIPLTRDNLLFSQRAIGNRGVAQLLQRKGNLSQAGDVYELETDRVKDGVQLQRAWTQSKEGAATGGAQPELEKEPLNFLSTAECSSCATGRPCDVCGAPMRKAIQDRVPVLSPVSVTGSGMPLPVSLAADFGARLRHPVDDAVIHADGAAAAAARSLHAEAFTIENHIYFGEGRWAPHTAQGRELLAHELVHVLHQRGAPAAARSTGDLEGEADRIGDTVARGGSVAASEVSVGAAPSHAPQARNSDEIDLDRAAIKTRLDEITADNIDVLDEYMSYIAVGMEPPEVVREAVDAIEREQLILGFVDDMLSAEETTGIQHITDILDVIQQAELESKTEESTIHYLMELTGSLGSVRMDVEQLILRNALRFPKVTMALYDSILESYARQYAERKQKFDAALAALLAKDKKELARLFIGMYTRADLSSTAAAYEQKVRLQTQSNPGFIQLKWGGVGEITAPEDLEFVVVHKWDMKAPSFPAPYGFLQEILYNWYLYRLYDHIYGEVYSRRNLFRVRATTVIGNMGPTVPSVLNLEDMLKEAFGTETLVSARGGIGRERVPGSGIYHFFKSYGGDGYQHVQQSMLGVLNPWVLGMGEWDRLMLAFELYDFFNKLGHQLSSLISIRTLITIVGFAVFIIGIQFVPFANLIVDAIIAFFFVQSVLAVLRMLGSLMMADYYCSNTKSFIDVHLATQELVGMDEDAAGALVDICTWGAGKLAKYAKYARKKPPSKIDDIVKEDPIAHGPAKVRDAGKTATERKVTHEKWEEGLDRASRDALEADANAAKAFRDMDPEVRRAFTLCSVDCLPVKPVPTQAQIDSVAALLKRTKTKSDNRALREYLKINRNNLDNALKELDKVTTKAGLDDFLDGKIIGRAKDRGWIAQREGPHQGWSLRKRAGDAPVSEYDIKPHGTQPGTDSFFQSHHGVQGEWAKERKIPGYDYDKQWGILLRDSRKGTPHQIATERQAGRAAGRASRNYSDERDLLKEDMKQAGVPDKIANDLLKQTDDYFAGLYNGAKAKGMKAAELKDLFGDWEPK